MIGITQPVRKATRMRRRPIAGATRAAGGRYWARSFGSCRPCGTIEVSPTICAARVRPPKARNRRGWASSWRIARVATARPALKPRSRSTSARPCSMIRP